MHLIVTASHSCDEDIPCVLVKVNSKEHRFQNLSFGETKKVTGVNLEGENVALSSVNASNVTLNLCHSQ